MTARLSDALIEHRLQPAKNQQAQQENANRDACQVYSTSYISIKGTDLSDATQVYSTSYLPVSLSTVSVSFDGGGLSLPGHLHFVSPGQINVQIPWEFQGQSSVAIKVTVAGNTADLQSNVYTVPLATYAPAFFLNSGTVADALDNTTGALITTVNPATAGEILQLYANGLGPVTNPQSSGP